MSSATCITIEASPEMDCKQWLEGTILAPTQNFSERAERVYSVFFNVGLCYLRAVALSSHESVRMPDPAKEAEPTGLE